MFSPDLLQVFMTVASIVIITVIANALKQMLLKNPNEPPLVFHWIPFIGSTVTYGIDPFKFFFDCQAKVRDVLSHSSDDSTEVVAVW